MAQNNAVTFSEYLFAPKQTEYNNTQKGNVKLSHVIQVDR